MYQIYDISPPLSPDTAVWPGDQPFLMTAQTRIEDGHSVALAHFTTTAHIGAHADAPAHYSVGAPTIDAVELTAYMGECLVVDAITTGAITPTMAESALSSDVERILFRTRAKQDHRKFPQPFAYFHPETLSLLGEAGVVLVGIDTPSVDPFDAKDLLAHHSLLKYNMRNLESLDLTMVPPGPYELIALPLKLVGMDGSPVRAVLRKHLEPTGAKMNRV